jgi:adenylosuccinate lyase
VEYFIALCEVLPELSNVSPKHFPSLRNVYEQFTEADAAHIKSTEKVTNHDVKAVEYFLKEKLEGLGLNDYREFIHFGLTSQDINNTAIPLLLKEFVQQHYLPQLNELIKMIDDRAGQWKDIPMLARTHGQPASPTRLGKEMEVFTARVKEQIKLLAQVPFAAKFGGATGNFNAHQVAYPEIDWVEFANEFVQGTLGLHRSHPTTQIEHYDHLAALFDNIRRINIIFIDYARDVWQYISMNYFTQKIKAGEVGSSAMPHKVNPIDFENAEGNLGMANAIFGHLSEKLPVSRLQRDLTDSTVLRNVGVPFAHTWIAFKSLQKGIDKLQLNEPAIHADLDENWAVVAEAIQTILRRHGYPNPYEALKALTRNNEKITESGIHNFIDSLKIDQALRDRLKSISPFNYTGI